MFFLKSLKSPSSSSPKYNEHTFVLLKSRISEYVLLGKNVVSSSNELSYDDSGCMLLKSRMIKLSTFDRLMFNRGQSIYGSQGIDGGRSTSEMIVVTGSVLASNMVEQLIPKAQAYAATVARKLTMLSFWSYSCCGMGQISGSMGYYLLFLILSNF